MPFFCALGRWGTNRAAVGVNLEDRSVPFATNFFEGGRYNALKGGLAMVVYLDLLVLLNFLVDFLLLLGTNRLLGYPPGIRRCALAAALGGLYGGACVMPGMAFLGSAFWYLVFLALMALIAFGCQRSTLRKGAVFLLLSMALGGASSGLKGGFSALLLASAGIAILCRIAFRGGAGQEFTVVTLQYGGRQKKITVLHDTGNTLRDPITGERVLVADAEVAKVLLKLRREDLEDPLRTMERRQIPGLRLVPYRAVGQPGGMLLAVRMEVLEKNRKTATLVAFAPQKLGGSCGYQALAGGAV